MWSSPEAETARREIQRVATHILARARKAADGEISLRVGLTGLATPAFGADREVLRLAGGHLIRETRVGGELRSRAVRVVGRTLAELADFAAVDLDADVDFGHDAPGVGDRMSPLCFDEAAAEALLGWYQLGAKALDRVIIGASDPSVVQLWPEHFDVAIDLETASGRCNLGAAPPDTTSDQPYLYVGPHGEVRTGDPAFWNAPFGALLSAERVHRDGDPVAAAVSFFRYGLRLLG
ncbi:MAG TPA: hypothetical protein VFN36_03985 [Solirubrobacteraceae bacterium]|nr:hypothetical protein [Solirubrobacteraceae bacterium]